MIIDVETAEKFLRQGRVVSISTDTVYGLAALVEDSAAVDAIFALKGRPKGQSILILAATIDDIVPFLVDPPELFYQMARAYWPGDVSLVLPVQTGGLPDAIRQGRQTAGFRIPADPVALALLRKTGPLAVTSANRSGEPAATSPVEVEEVFGSEFPVLKGRLPPSGVASTVVEIVQQGGWRPLREGARTTAAIAKDFGPPVSFIQAS